MRKELLIEQINSLLALDRDGALRPHGLGGLARDLFERSVTALTNPVDDWTVDDTETAGEILTMLGIGCDASKEPGADWRRDKIAKIIRARIVSSSPGKDGGREVEAVKTVWQVADAIDPERSPDGGWRDQLLNEIHADLENRGRRDKDFAVTVHHRNIVISAVSKALRGLPSVSKEAAPMKDHARGCEGRNYTCTCGHDAKRDDLIDRLTKALEPFCKHYEPWMERWDDQEASSTFSRHTFGDLREALAAINEARAAVSSTSREGER